jgi:hypothetical protein
VAAAVAIAGSALVLAAVKLPAAVRNLNNQAAHNASLSAADRELELARRLGIDGDFVVAAERVLPARAVYSLETGPHETGTSALGLQALSGYLQNLLLPRLQLRGAAPWLLCYGCDPGGRRVHVAWRKGGLLIAQVQP